MYALNPNHSSEKNLFWVRADPIRSGAGETGGTIKTSTDCPPGVSDSIEMHNGRQATRRATSKGSWGNAQSSTLLSALKSRIQVKLIRGLRPGVQLSQLLEIRIDFRSLNPVRILFVDATSTIIAPPVRQTIPRSNQRRSE